MLKSIADWYKLVGPEKNNDRHNSTELTYVYCSKSDDQETGVQQSYSHINAIIIDDEKWILKGGLSVLKKVLTEAKVQGFQKPSEALEFASSNRVDLAFLDIELGSVNGLDLCRNLLAVNPNMNVVFLTSCADYAFSAWNTGARGYLLKPLTEQKLRSQLSLLKRFL